MCITCSWHAFIPVIDRLDLWCSIDGYVHFTLAEYLEKSNSSRSPDSQAVYFLDRQRNQTMVKKSVLTTGERLDRYAFFFFASVFIGFHIVFGAWMYLSVSKKIIQVQVKRN